jgi:hypothetical protein
MAHKDFYIDKSPDGMKYYIDAELVPHSVFLERRSKECSHRWDAGRCKDCGLPKDPACG